MTNRTYTINFVDDNTALVTINNGPCIFIRHDNRSTECFLERMNSQFPFDMTVSKSLIDVVACYTAMYLD